MRGDPSSTAHQKNSPPTATREFGARIPQSKGGAFDSAQGVLPLEGQDSNMLRSFAQSDALIYIPKEKQQINKGETVEVHLLPFEN